MTDPSLAFVAINDLAAITRGRALPLKDLNPVSGVGWVPANLAINAFGDLIKPNPFGALGDLRLIPDMNTEATFPLPGGSAQIFLATQSLPDGTPWECCPRAALATATARLERDHGLQVVAAFEHEFALVDGAGEPEGAGAFTIAGLADGEPFGSAARQALTDAGIDWENWLPEFGLGQFEVTLKPLPAMRAADAAVLTRDIVRSVARMHGRRATFAPLLHPDAVGNGVHVHLSLWQGETPVSYDPQGPQGMSTVASAACAGILAHAPALIMWTAPSHVSALRLLPHRWSAAGAFVGLQNREALVRLPALPFGSDPARSFNLEYRAADATANPYLVLAVLIHSMCDGFDRGLSLDSVLTGSIDDSTFPPLPKTLAEAIQAFLDDEIARAWFAPDLVETAITIRRGEAETISALDAAARCRAYASVY
ncbi:MAG: glutamine synthetase family protein [Actinomycetota bacterium]|nr:glutamine synthetase family protein [Chloroflexota bacterium]MDA3022272.1 glutamine synthetase family protein [Actinomycetota bacterium]